MLKRTKVLLFLPFCILFFPLLVLIGKRKTENIGDWITDID